MGVQTCQEGEGGMGRTLGVVGRAGCGILAAVGEAWWVWVPLRLCCNVRDVQRRFNLTVRFVFSFCRDLC